MTTSAAQAFVNSHGHRGDFSRFIDGQQDVERDDCPVGSEVRWFFSDGSIIWHDFDAGWEVIDGTGNPGCRGEAPTQTLGR